MEGRMSYASNNNAVLIDGCNNLHNLSVLLEVVEDIATTDGNGWTFQLNCYPPAGEYCQTSQLNFLQYIVYVQGGNLAYEIQYWANGASTWPSGYTPQPNTTPWLPCWANDYFLSPPFASISGDTLPRQSTLQIKLGTNDAGGVTKVKFTYTDPNGNDHSVEFDPPAVHPVVACELNFVGPGNFANANFTQGLTSSRGIIYYSVSSGQLSVQNGGPGAACGEAGLVTGETSNMTYSDISGAPASTVTQILQQPVSCAVNSLFEGDQAKLGEMRQIRDRQVAQHAAGQWLIEVLDRHSADLALLVASGKGDLAQGARDLLTKAVHTARQGRVFDATTVDDALKVLERASCKLPPTMNEVGRAGATLLESLRGRTLEDGLNAASKTILPRFRAPQRPREKCGERLAQRVADLEERVRRLECR
jgi:hypothetical protein